MKQCVIQAIRERRLLRVDYARRSCLTVAPQVLGETMTGYLALFCWQAGQARDDEAGWRLLDFDRISKVQVLPQHFAPLPDHRGLPSREFKSFEAVV